MKSTLEEIYNYQIKTNTIDFTNSKLNFRMDKDIDHKAARYFENGFVSFAAHKGDITDDAILALAKSNYLQTKSTYEAPFTNPTRDERDYRDQSIYKSSDLEGLYLEVQAILEPYYSEYVFMSQIDFFEETVCLKRSDDTLIKTSSCSTHLSCRIRQKGSSSTLDYFIDASANTKDNFFQKIKQQLKFLKTFDVVKDFDHTKEYPSLFASPGCLMPHISGSAHARPYTQKTALFSGKLNEKILSDKITLVDKHWDPSAGLFNFFDDEGTIKTEEPLVIVENGIFKNVISSTYDSHLFNHKATGNGIKPGYAHSPKTQFFNLQLAKGDKTFQESLEDMKLGTLIFFAFGGDSTDTGDLASPVQLSFLVKDGEIAGRLPQLSYQTHVNKALGSDLMSITSRGVTSDSKPCPIVNMKFDTI